MEPDPLPCQVCFLTTKDSVQRNPYLTQTTPTSSVSPANVQLIATATYQVLKWMNSYVMDANTTIRITVSSAIYSDQSLSAGPHTPTEPLQPFPPFLPIYKS